MPDNKRPLYNDGEGLDHNDLNLGQNSLLHTLGDLYVYPRLCENSADATYDTDYDTAVAPQRHCYTIGGRSGFMGFPTSTTWELGAGVYAQYTALTAPVVGVNNFKVVQIGDGEVTGSITPAAASTRYDRLEIKIEDIAGDSQTRDFKDATTGALSTTVLNKSTLTQATVRVLTGTEGAGIPAGMQGLQSGYVPIGYIEVDTGGIVRMHSCVRGTAMGFRRWDSISMNAYWAEVASGWDEGALASANSVRGLGTPYLQSTGATGLGNELLCYSPADNRDRIVSVTVRFEDGLASSAPGARFMLADETGTTLTRTFSFPNQNTTGGFANTTVNLTPELGGELFSLWGGGDGNPKTTFDTPRLVLALAPQTATTRIQSVIWTTVR